VEQNGASVIAQLTSFANSRLQEIEAELEGFENSRARLDEAVSKLTDERAKLRGLVSTYEAVPIENGQRLSSATQRRELADMVVELLRENGRPMHYREIERELRARGLFAGGGKDPANGLLATYFDDDRLYRPARGTYEVKPDNGGKRSVGTKKKRKASRRGRAPA
jgi:HB1, ASXL, restriction endonuclease HTH domain